MPAASHQLAAGAPDTIHETVTTGKDPGVEPLVVASVNECIAVGLQADDIGRCADGDAFRGSKSLAATGEGTL